jgi:uncharacterized protein YoxC
MKATWAALALLLSLLCSSPAFAVQRAPGITERELIESLTRLEAGVRANTEAIARLRQEMGNLRQETYSRIGQLREDMNKQFDRIDAQFDRVINVMLGILGAFTALAVLTIGFALWDRRTMIRPFEEKTKQIAEDLSQNRQSLRSLLDALRALSQSDEKVAEVLKRFNLL